MAMSDLLRVIQRDEAWRVDERYQHTTCATCGQRYQRIDFRGALHLFTCRAPREAQ